MMDYLVRPSPEGSASPDLYGRAPPRPTSARVLRLIRPLTEGQWGTMTLDLVVTPQVFN